MKVELVVTGVKEFNIAIEELLSRVDYATMNATALGGHTIEKYAKQRFGPRHDAGTPKTVFDRPNSISTDLKGSIMVRSVMKKSLGWEAKVAPDMIYGRRVELGFPEGTHAYPYLFPGAKDAESDILSTYQTYWQNALA